MAINTSLNMLVLKSPVITVLMAVLFLSGSAVAYAGIQSYSGDEITISGSATSGPNVYLFLTGPNLPVNGVALHDITKRADQGGFTVVSVDGDDRWTYHWNTGSINGKLDDGTYTIWVVSGPNDRSRLAKADYRTISVTLGKPFVTVDTPAQPGTMDLRSVPDGASVTINGDYRGKTPLVITGLSPGTYEVTFSRFGYVKQPARVTVQAGSTSEVAATLQPESGTLAVNSSPAGARVLLDGTYAGISPLVIMNLSAGNHTVGLEMDGRTTAARDVTVAAGQILSVDVILDPVPVSPAATRAAGLLPATAAAFCIILLYPTCRRRHR